MEPSKFKQANRVLTAPKGMTPEECGDLHVFSDGQECISLWKGSWRERLSFLFFGHLWLYVMSGQTQPPVALSVTREIFKEQKTDWKVYFRNRFYMRGTSPLGLLNTLTACLFNRVLVLHLDDAGKIVNWHIGRGTDFPPAEQK